MTITFRYFEIEHLSAIAVKVRGKMSGKLKIYTDVAAPSVGEILLQSTATWKEYSGPVRVPTGICSLSFKFEGRGKFDLLEFKLS